MTWKELEIIIRKMPKATKNRQVKIFGYGWSMYSTYFEPNELTIIKSTPELMRQSFGHVEGIKRGLIEVGEPVIDLSHPPTSEFSCDIRHKNNNSNIKPINWKQKVISYVKRHGFGN